MPARAITFSEFQQRMDDKFGARFKLVEFNGTAKRCTFICPEHGLQSPKSPASVMILQGYGCVECANEARTEKIALPKAEHLARIKAAHGDKYTVISFKPDEKQRVPVNCPDHGEFLTRLVDLARGEGCPECARVRLAPERSARIPIMIAARRAARADKPS